MKFELKTYNRNIPDEEFLNDLKRIAGPFQQQFIGNPEHPLYE
jgi:hypothetical protein